MTHTDDVAGLVERLGDEADLCRNDGADDIAELLDEAQAALQSQAAEIARLRGALERIELNAHTTGRIAIRDEARVALAQQGGDDGQ